MTDISPLPPYLHPGSPDGVSIRIRASPGARHNRLEGIYGAALRVRIKAPPVDGKANLALTRFLADLLQVPRGAVRLTHGETSRDKIVHIAGVQLDTIAHQLTELLQDS
ncbi:MAG: hypothetical protein CMH54_13540 [Myxococcales bacterium]|nr:hypothetical protein [Myxococcales bacterium]